MTLTEFLLARIAEDENMARRAEPGRWKLWGMGVMADPKGTSDVADCIEVAVARTPSTADGLPWTFNATHIARHDPARVLAECEAKRRIVEKAQRADVAFDHQMNPTTTAASFALTEVLHFLALPYADHPDYQPDWRL